MSAVQGNSADSGAPTGGGDVHVEALNSEGGVGLDGLGARIRAARAARGISARELARKVDCSASMISQIELGRANPSVSTLYDISSALQISLDRLFSKGWTAQAEFKESTPEDPVSPQGRAATRQEDAHSAFGSLPTGEPDRQLDPWAAPVNWENPAILRKRGRRTIDLADGVRWELLMPVPEHSAEFMEVHYAPGGGSVEKGHAIRHIGREYGVICEGVLSVQLGFEQYELEPGDSMAFDSTIPHRYWNARTEPVRGIFFNLDRWQVADSGWDTELRSHP
jgi:transcriptional regulator with XRE-family HTH domain